MGKIIWMIIKSLGVIFSCVHYSIWEYIKRKKTSRLIRYNKLRKLVLKEEKHLRIRYHVSGLENIPNEQSFMITPNHQSIVDVLIFFDLFKDPISFVAKSQLSKVPCARKIVPIIEGYFLERDNLRQEIKVMKNVQNSLLNDNIKWVIFPEGTRTKDPNFKLNTFKAGTYKFPMSIDKKIVPCALHGTSYVFDKKVHRKYYDVYVHFFNPLTPEFYKGKSTQEVSSYIENIIQEKVDEFIELDKSKNS